MKCNRKSFFKNFKFTCQPKISINYSNFKTDLYGISNSNESILPLEYVTQRYVYALSELAVGGRCKVIKILINKLIFEF